MCDLSRIHERIVEKSVHSSGIKVEKENLRFESLLENSCKVVMFFILVPIREKCTWHIPTVIKIYWMQLF